ncbi:MAG: 2'-5' RNA ligase family protein [Ferrovibrio sp.]
MTAFLRDPHWNRPLVSYTVMTLLEPAARDTCMQALQRIATEAGGMDRLLVAPAETFHLSLFAIAPVRSDFDKDAWWAIHGPQALAVFRRWCDTQAATLLRFRELRVTQTAVIAVAERSDAVWRLRDMLRAGVPQPPGGTPVYDMIHMTLARFAAPDLLPAGFAARVAALPLTLDVPLHRVSVMRETAYPLLGGSPVETRALRAPEEVS